MVDLSTVSRLVSRSERLNGLSVMAISRQMRILVGVGDIPAAVSGLACSVSMVQACLKRVIVLCISLAVGTAITAVMTRLTRGSMM